MNASGHPHPAFEAAAAAIVASGRRLGARRLMCGTDGNISVRLDEAVDRLEVLDRLCSAWQAAWLLGGDPRRPARRRPLRGTASRGPSPIRRP